MPYFSIEERYGKNSNGFELPERRGTVGETTKTIREIKQFHALVGQIAGLAQIQGNNCPPTPQPPCELDQNNTHIFWSI